VPGAKTVPCPVCATPVDPLRAPRVAHRGGRFRYYCSPECYERRDREARAGASHEVTTALDPAARDERAADASDEASGSASDIVADGSTASESRPSLDAQSSLATVGADGDRSIERFLPAELVLPSLVEFDAEPSLEQVIAMIGVAPSGAEVAAAVAEPVARVEARAKVAARPEEPEDVRPILVSAAAVFVALVATRVGGTISTVLAALAAFVALTVAARELFWARGMAPWWLWANPFAGALVALVRAVVRERPVTSLALSTTVAFVLPVAGYVARAARSSAQRSLEAQGSVLPRTARVRRADNGELRTVEAQALKAGEEIVVDAGERVAADGVVREALGVIVEEPSGTRSLIAGHAVLAGTLVRKGTLRVLATRAGDDVALARVRTTLDEGATGSLLFGESFARVLAAVSVVAVLALVVLAAPRDPLATVALVLGALPPGLALPLARVPFAHALAAAISRGTVFRDAAALELSARVRALIFCVRATLTRGSLELVEIVSLGSLSERALLATAAGAESMADDGGPFAKALVNAARSRGVRPEAVRRPSLVAGRGVLAATAQGAPVVVGSRALMIAENVAVAPGEEVARSIEAQGRHALFLAIDGRLEGVFGFDDPPREEARAAVQTLMDKGLDVAFVGGESAGTLEAIGLAIDVAHVRAEVPPEERGAAVRSLAEVAGRVAVAGRPVLDDVALGAGDVSIGIEAAGGAGAETSIALTGDDLREVSRALVDARGALQMARRAAAVSLLATTAAVLAAVFAPSPKVAAPIVLALAVVGALVGGRVASAGFAESQR